MKKFLSMFLVVAMIVSFTACGGSKFKASITTNDGESVEKSFEELCEERSSNSVSFSNKYEGASISFTGTVESVSEYYQSTMKVSIQQIDFEEGAQLQLLKGSYDDVVNNISKGDKVEVTSAIHGGGTFDIYLNDLHGTGSNMTDNTTIAIVK